MYRHNTSFPYLLISLETSSEALESISRSSSSTRDNNQLDQSYRRIPARPESNHSPTCLHTANLKLSSVTLTTDATHRAKLGLDITQLVYHAAQLIKTHTLLADTLYS